MGRRAQGRVRRRPARFRAGRAPQQARCLRHCPARPHGPRQSRVVARLDPGISVTTPASDVDYVVTEYGVARLAGCTLEERARALAAVAHPDDRASLRAGLTAG